MRRTSRPKTTVRHTDPDRRTELVEAFCDYLLEHGLSEWSLRSAAVALRTSHRMLLYHFGSKERLVAESIAALRAREIGMIDFGGIDSLDQVMWRLWDHLTAPGREPFIRLFFETWTLALKEPSRFPGFLDGVIRDLLSVFEEGLVAGGLARRESRAIATLHLASFRGLMLDLLTTGDRARVKSAVELIASDLKHRLSSSPKRK